MKFRPAKKSFTIDDLPANRKEQFIDFLKTRFGLFLSFGGLFLLFGLPLLAAFLFKYYAILLPASKTLTETEYPSFYKSTCLLFDAIYCFCFLFLFLALSGLGRIFRQWAWGKGVFFFHDFLTGLKRNFPTYLFLWFLFSIFFLLSEAVSLTVAQTWISYLVSGFAILLLPILFMAMSQTIFYSNNLGKLLSNSFSYCFKKPLSTIAFMLFPYAALCLNLIDQVMIMALVMALSLLLISPFYFVGWNLFSLSLFDEFTNRENYPSVYQKGLKGEFLGEREDG